MKNEDNELFNIKPVKVKDFFGKDALEPLSDQKLKEDPIYNYLYKITTYAHETRDDFIFKVISSFCFEVAKYKISKKLLEKAIIEYMKNHPEEVAAEKERQRKDEEEL